MHVQYAFVKMMVRVVLLSRNYSTLVWCGYDDSTNWCVKQETSDDEGGPYTYTVLSVFCVLEMMMMFPSRVVMVCSMRCGYGCGGMLYCTVLYGMRSMI